MDPGDDLAELHRTEYGSLVRMAVVLLGDQGAAEEVTQDAFAAVQRRTSITALDDPDKLLSYVRSAVLNGARSALRRRGVVARMPWRRVEHLSSAEEDALVGNRRAELVRAMRTLPGRQCECLVLRYFLDLSDAQIAATLDLSLGTVKTHIFRGLAALRSKLEESNAN